MSTALKNSLTKCRQLGRKHSWYHASVLADSDFDISLHEAYWYQAAYNKVLTEPLRPMQRLIWLVEVLRAMYDNPSWFGCGFCGIYAQEQIARCRAAILIQSRRVREINKNKAQEKSSV